MDNEHTIRELGQFLTENRFTLGNSGNISIRLGEDSCLITASGSELGNLSEEDLVDCAFGEQKWSGGRKASKELPMHQAIYEERQDIGGIIHATPFYSTLIACSNLELPKGLFVEEMYYLEKIERVPFFQPGSKELGEAVRQAADKADIILMENHGVLVYDKTLSKAKAALETLEFTSKMVIQAKAVNSELALLDKERIALFLDDSTYKPRKRWGDL
ncbi:L-fuculose-phosphate aldolase [Scopulibacillus darangshiensis]|uniref:L-fuculose-phosphate aldolase n=1 Tax=Scopulibacillus darangshiensis TaxID=442528 RepID=A0A4R2P6N7_9BACL|nr:class II aldolase/adducin family protein [Scopulibacillus darangshiensis]TCP29465.1 L-fuculose-phosphate aldolase [Scopulibacillus darangshiensis]